MRRVLFFIAIFLFTLSSVMGQMIPINLPADGNWPTIVGDSIMIIGPRQNELTEEQRYFNPVYLMTYPGKEHLKAQMIRAGACDCDPTIPNRRIGVFSVAPDKQVSFSQGNLQYLPAINLWKFADTQYEYLGNANKYLKPTFRNWVDLFGWSANNTTAPFGVSTSTNAADYAGDFVDWGENMICGDAPGTWRTLSREEWEYLINNRANAKQLCGVACVHGVNGLILLPDDWIAPTGIPFTSGTHDKDGSSYFAQVNDYTIEQWQRMEESEAVFLPTAGVIRRDGAIRAGIRASYWSSTGQGTKGYILNFHSNFIITPNEERYGGRSVRLVHDTIVSKIEPEYVDLGLSVKWATFNVGATSPEDYGDYFAWGETEPKEEYTWENYKWCDGDYTKLNKYCTKEQYGIVDNQTILQACDDAAYTKLGGNWRMPTMEECQELVKLCTWKWTTINGINGHVITGPNGNTIFLPATGAITTSGLQNAGESGYYWINSISTTYPYNANDLYNSSSNTTMDGSYGINAFSRYIGRPIRAVYDDRPTLTVIPTPEDAKVSFLCKGYQAVGHSITVDKGKDVLYQVTNVDAGYLSQGDSIYNLTKDSVLYVTLRPFSDGNWVKVNKSEYTKQEGYYVSRNNGGFASHSVWNYYVLPVLPGETYRVRGIAGQHAALWIAASTAPDAATNTRPTKISCCANRGVAAYVADEVTIPDGAKYLIINSRNGKEMMVERKVPDPCLVVKVNDTLSINMMCVEGGTFMMGSDAPGAEADEQPVHEVTLSDYYIGQTEVTQHLWKAVMGSGNNPSATKGNNLPVTDITWDETQQFVERLSELTGLRFRLPTEAEWEYAARGGQYSKGYTYAGSNDIDQVGWYNGNSSNKTHAVGQKQPNELGIYDMTGNVWEYCYDWHTPYAAQAQTNPTGATTGDKHVLRGGCYHYDPKNCTNTNRHSYYTPDKGGASTGLRIVLEP